MHVARGRQNSSVQEEDMANNKKRRGNNSDAAMTAAERDRAERRAAQEKQRREDVQNLLLLIGVIAVLAVVGIVIFLTSSGSDDEKKAADTAAVAATGIEAEAEAEAAEDDILVGAPDEEIEEAVMNYDAVVINDVDAQIRNDLLKYCYKYSIRTYSVPKLSDVIYSGSEDIMLFDTPLKLIRGRGLTPAQRFVKRAMDLVLCFIAMIPSSIIMLIIAIAIKLEDGGSVFYRQRRVTKDGKQFDILKFRSMIENAEADGKPHPATDNDDRITKVGKVIRTLRVDELPQLLNIIKGDMSIVGPRPERVEHCEMYGAEIPEFEFRNKVKGGLTAASTTPQRLISSGLI